MRHIVQIKIKPPEIMIRSHHTKLKPIKEARSNQSVQSFW